jgi:hypothetical protein
MQGRKASLRVSDFDLSFLSKKAVIICDYRSIEILLIPKSLSSVMT